MLVPETADVIPRRAEGDERWAAILAGPGFVRETEEGGTEPGPPAYRIDVATYDKPDTLELETWVSARPTRVGYRRAASNGADREAGLKATGPASPEPSDEESSQGRRCCSHGCRKSPRRGCRKATRWGGQPPRLGCGVGTRVPVAPRRRRRRGCRRWQRAQEGMPIRIGSKAHQARALAPRVRSGSGQQKAGTALQPRCSA